MFIEQTYNFYNLNIFGRYIAFNSLNMEKLECDDDFLNIYSIDEKIFDVKKINVNIIAMHFDNLIDSAMLEYLDLQEAVIYEDIIIDEICSFLLNIYTIDPIAYRNIIKQMLSIDYKFNKYLINKKLDNDCVESEIRVKKVEENTISKLVEDSIYDEEYACELLVSVLNIKSIYEEKNRSLKEEIIDEYYEKNIPVKIRKKLD